MTGFAAQALPSSWPCPGAEQKATALEVVSTSGILNGF
jgi:hypothetical protein